MLISVLCADLGSRWDPPSSPVAKSAPVVGALSIRPCLIGLYLDALLKIEAHVLTSKLEQDLLAEGGQWQSSNLPLKCARDERVDVPDISLFVLPVS